MNSPQQEIAKLLATAVDLHRQGRLEQAENLYRTILAVDPRHADALHFLGVAAHQRGDHANAAAIIGQAIELNRKVPPYHFNRGVALQALHDYAGAAQSYRRAVQLKPDYGSAWENLGVALQDAGDYDSARAAYGKALGIDPRAIIANQNLGTLLLNLGQLPEAQERFRAVLAVAPAHAEAHAKYAITLLAQGRYAEGWQEHEWRHHSQLLAQDYRPRLVPFPKWDGTSLEGKTLLIHPEQGIGEELMFASCYADAIAQARYCIVECDPRLVGVFARTFPQATILAGNRAQDFVWDATLPHIDWRVPAGSLPQFLRRRTEDFPNHRGYLRVDEERRMHWQQALAALGKPLTVGISWRGGRDARAIKARSVALAEWQGIFGASDIAFVNLQYGNHAEEIAAFNAAGPGRLHTLEGVDPFANPDDAMALIAALDLVISIDNSTVFMAGSVGTPVWALLPPNGEWRWRGAENRSPWYPHARLFRQERPGSDAWRATLRQVATELHAHVHDLVRSRDSSQQPPPTLAHVHVGAAIDSDRALLLNDTRTWYHWGCSGTSLALHSQLRRRFKRVESLPIQRLIALPDPPASLEDFDDDARFGRFAAAHPDVVAKLRDTDTIVVNGEGTLHGVNPQVLNLLYVAYVAKRRLGKTVHIVNHSCYPDGTNVAKESPVYALYRKIYAAMDFIAVREPVSAKLVADLGLAVTESFDCLPLFVREHATQLQRDPRQTARTVVIGGSVAWGHTGAALAIGELIVKLHEGGLLPIVLIGADAYMAADDVQFAATLQRVAAGHFVLVNATSELEWLRTIANAELLISGRFHHTIAAACLGTPFIVMESNTPKIAGLLQRLESRSFVSVTRQGFGAELFERAKHLLTHREAGLVSAEVRENLIALAERNFWPEPRAPEPNS